MSKHNSVIRLSIRVWNANVRTVPKCTFHVPQLVVNCTNVEKNHLQKTDKKIYTV